MPIQRSLVALLASITLSLALAHLVLLSVLLYFSHSFLAFPHSLIANRLSLWKTPFVKQLLYSTDCSPNNKLLLTAFHSQPGWSLQSGKLLCAQVSECSYLRYFKDRQTCPLNSFVSEFYRAADLSPVYSIGQNPLLKVYIQGVEEDCLSYIDDPQCIFKGSAVQGPSGLANSSLTLKSKRLPTVLDSCSLEVFRVMNLQTLSSTLVAILGTCLGLTCLYFALTFGQLWVENDYGMRGLELFVILLAFLLDLVVLIHYSLTLSALYKLQFSCGLRDTDMLVAVSALAESVHIKIFTAVMTLVVQVLIVFTHIIFSIFFYQELLNQESIVDERVDTENQSIVSIQKDPVVVVTRQLSYINIKSFVEREASKVLKASNRMQNLSVHQSRIENSLIKMSSQSTPKEGSHNNNLIQRLQQKYGEQ